MEDKKLNMITGKLTPDALSMINAITGVLRMGEPSCGTSAMLAILSAHFINMEVDKEAFLNICSETYSFYKLQIDESNSKKDVKDGNE